jgi:hypothetical protein
MVFVMEWGAYTLKVRTLILKNAPTTFQRMVQEILYAYLASFMGVFFNDFIVFKRKDEHLEHL